VAVWRPIEAARVGEDGYRILSANSDRPEKPWEFDHGDFVRCAGRMLPGIPARSRVARASSEAGTLQPASAGQKLNRNWKSLTSRQTSWSANAATISPAAAATGPIVSILRIGMAT
jgi:hypothetical protein